MKRKSCSTPNRPARGPRVDERSAEACRRVQQICFALLCGGVLLDVLVEFNLHIFQGNAEGALALFAAVGWKALLLAAVFYLNLFLLARQGVLFGVTDRDLSTFPRRACARISALVALALAVGLWVPRFFFFFDPVDVPLWGAALIFGFLMLATFAISFGVVLGSFYLAFRRARRAYTENTTDD